MTHIPIVSVKIEIVGQLYRQYWNVWIGERSQNTRETLSYSSITFLYTFFNSLYMCTLYIDIVKCYRWHVEECMVFWSLFIRELGSVERFWKTFFGKVGRPWTVPQLGRKQFFLKFRHLEHNAFTERNTAYSYVSSMDIWIECHSEDVD